MLRHYSDFDIYTDQPILRKLKQILHKRSKDKSLIKLFDNHVSFLYPRVLAFSVVPYSKRATTLYHPFSKEEGYEEPSHTNNHQEKPKPSLEHYRAFVDILSYCIATLGLKLIFLFDLRELPVFEEDLILGVIDRIRQEVDELIILASDDLKNELAERVSSDSYGIYFSIFDIKSRIEELAKIDAHVLEIKLPSRVSLNALEEALSPTNLGSDLSDKFFVSLNVREVTSINAFPMSLINHFLHDYWVQDGVLFRIEGEPIHRNLIRRLSDFRIFKVNRLFLLEDREPETELRFTPRIFGGYLFDEKRLRKIIKRFDNYLLTLRKMFSSYLDQQVTIRYEHPNTSYKPRVSSLTYAQVIRDIVYELVDNVITHAEGVGYLAAEISKYHLYLYIGDCGIGLHHGILKNYNMEKEINDSQSALNFLFELPDYQERRRSKLESMGAGVGLRNTLTNIFTCEGKFCVRTENKAAFYMNPVQKASRPSQVIGSSFSLSGVQYMIILPLFRIAVDTIPQGYQDFLSLDY